MKIGYVVLCLVGMALVMGALAWLIPPWAKTGADWLGAALGNWESLVAMIVVILTGLWWVVRRT